MTMKIVDTDTVSGVGMMWIVDTIRSVQEVSVTHHTTTTITTIDIMDRNATEEENLFLNKISFPQK